MPLLVFALATSTAAASGSVAAQDPKHASRAISEASGGLAAGLALLPAPNLLTPASGSRNVSTTPTFTWSAVEGATLYWLNVATSREALPIDPAAIQCPGCAISCFTYATSHTFESGCAAGTSQPLPSGVKYFWSVQGFNETVNGEYSSSRSFTVKAVPEIRVTPTSISLEPPLEEQTVAVGSDDPVDEVDPSSGGRQLTLGSAASRLLQRVEEQGRMRVLVRVAGPEFSPEGRLSRALARSQRAAIARSQDLLLAALGRGVTRAHRFETIPYLAFEVDRAGLIELLGSSQVLDVQEDLARPPALAGSVPSIGAPIAWAQGLAGQGQTIAILDTGVDKSHPYFTATGAKVVSEACYSTNSSASTSLCPGGVTSSTASGSATPCSNPAGDCAHGTHVAGIAAGNDGVGPNVGVAKDSDIISIQIFSKFTGTQCAEQGFSPCIAAFDSDWIRALERVYELRDEFTIASVNMSFGGGSFASNCDAVSGAAKAAVDNLRSVGIAAVAASGNEFSRNALATPACISSVISVGATDDGIAIPGFSNISSFISLMAPGLGVTSAVTGGGVASFSGTSMSAPHVAGAWAILRQQRPQASVSELLETLRDTGTVLADTRTGGTVTDLRRVDIALAILATPAPDQFAIVNDGAAPLSVTSIQSDPAAGWLQWTPQAPFEVAPGSQQLVTVSVDFAAAPPGTTATRLLISSDDSDENPFPEGVDVTTKNTPCGDGFVDPGEDCDDGDKLFEAGQYCSSACTQIPCGKPTDSAGVNPTATDASFVLRAAVGQIVCDIRVCDVDGNLAVLSSDAQRALRSAVGQDVSLECPSEPIASPMP